jgi:hypothetical protein
MGRGRALAAACLILASPAACAHGGSVPAWIPVMLLTALAGFVVCLFVPLFALSGEPVWVRIVAGLGLTALDLLIWYAITWSVFKAWPGLALPPVQANVVAGLLGLVPWIIPAVLVARKLARRR